MDMTGELSQKVLVLNSDYVPLNICNIRRAIALVYLGKVDVLHTNHRKVLTSSGEFIAPSVVRLKQHIKRPMPRIRLSRRNIIARDDYTCQYCGYNGNDLTVDHIIPKRLGGPVSWENLVCCCKKCNSKKSDKSLVQVGFVLIREPRKPKYMPYISISKLISGDRNRLWRDYLPIFDDEAAAASSEH